VGRPEIAVEFLNQWGIDEIIMIDISARRAGLVISPELVKRASASCLVPLTVGGGIGRLADIDALLQAGADKVCMNRVLRDDPAFVTEAARKFGNQCIVASVDALAEPGRDGAFRVYDYLGGGTAGADLGGWLAEAEARGAGEVLLNAVHRDGSREGFDIALIRAASARLTIPVIALGGAGHVSHFKQALRDTTAQAVCAANFFHYMEHSVIATKAALVRDKIAVRLETKATYADAALDAAGRLAKRPDDVLEHLLYVRIEKEII
jgi:cyclase